MSKYNLFPSWRHSVSGEGLETLEKIFKDSKKIGLDLDYNEGRAAFRYLSVKLKKIEEDNGFFTVDQFEKTLRGMPSWTMSKEQVENLKIISRGSALKPKIEPKLEEKLGIEEKSGKTEKVSEFGVMKKTEDIEKPPKQFTEEELQAIQNQNDALSAKRREDGLARLRANLERAREEAAERDRRDMGEDA